MVGAMKEMDGGLLVACEVRVGTTTWEEVVEKEILSRERDSQGREAHQPQETWFCHVIDSQYFKVGALIKKCLPASYPWQSAKLEHEEMSCLQA